MIAKSLSLDAIMQPTRSFAGWWGGELFAMLPQKIQAWFLARQDKLLVHADASSFAISSAGQTDSGDVRTIPRDAPLSEEIPREANLVLDNDYVLSTEFSLPVLTGRDLYNAVELQVDRQLPLKLDRVYYGFNTGPGADDHQMTVRLAIIRREDTDQAIDDMRQLKLEPGQIAVESNKGQSIPLRFSVERLNKATSWRKRLVFLLFFSAFILLSATLLLHWNNLGQTQADLTLRLQGAQITAADVQRETAMVEVEQKKWRLLSTELDRPDLAGILVELSRLLPDHSWIAELQLRGNSLRMTGYSEEPESLTSLLTDAEIFSNVRLNSVVPGTGANARSRFDLTLEIAAGNSVEEATDD